MDFLNSYSIIILLVITAIIIAIIAAWFTLRKRGQAELTAMPEETKNAAAMLLSKIKIPTSSEVLFVGPVSAGTVIKEDTPAGEGFKQVALQVSDEPGKYYVFFINDKPGFLFVHPVRYAWLNIETGDYAVVDAEWQPRVQEPGKDPLIFKRISVREVAGLKFIFGKSGAGSINDVSHKPQAGPALTTPTSGCKKMGLVIDGGDNDGFGDAADNLAEDGDSITEFLIGNGFRVQRISQYWDNNHSMLPHNRNNPGDMRASLQQIIQSYGQNLSCEPNCCHELFIHIGAHGNQFGFALKDPTGSGDLDFISFNDFNQWFSAFPGCIKLIFLINSCESGAAVNVLSGLCAGRDCGMTIMTATDAQNFAASGQGLTDSAIEDFMQGTDDLDGDGKSGDLGDRWKSMENQAGGRNPQLFMCPGQTTLCSMD